MAEPYTLTTLPSGLRVATEQLSGMESVTFCVSFNVGARYEHEEEHGLAHLLEHMAFKGTPTRNALKIAEQFDAIGGNVNAYTSNEHTVYYARVLREYLPEAVETLADILQHSVFDEQELIREKEVVIQEIGQNEDSPEDLVFDYLHQVAFADSPLGRGILGTEESVRQFTPEDLHQFIRRNYHTPAMVIAAAGNITHQETLDLVNRHFTDFPSNHSPEYQRTLYHTGQKCVEKEQEQVQIMLGFESFPLLDADYYALQLLSTIFGGGMSSRLFQEIREKRGLAYSISSFLTSYHDVGMIGIHAATGEEHAAELLQVLQEESQKLLQGVTAEELSRAKQQHRAGVLMRRESPTSMAEWMARHLQDYREFRNAEELIRRVQAVTQEDIQRIATRIFTTPRISLAALGPGAEKLR
jgi:predicted Zn-dependent peptidase